jgi:LysM repeat protein
VEESYEDHAEFLDQSPRYDSLFAYSSSDYRSWARGLKAAGYATAPDYAQRLTRIIEENLLFLFDEDNGAELYAARMRAERGRVDDEFASQSSVDMPQTVEGGIDPNSYRVPERTYNGYSVYANNGVHYVVARDGDSFARIAQTFALTERTLRKWNEINPKSVADPVAGEWIYIEQKQSKWQGEGSSHRVATGETLTSIAQEYGIREKRLRSMNRLKSGAALVEGQMLKLN